MANSKKYWQFLKLNHTIFGMFKKSSFQKPITRKTLTCVEESSLENM